MNDRDFLIWLHERLQYVHGENPHVDYMFKLRNIIEYYPKNKVTQNTCTFNNLKDLIKHLNENNNE